LTKKKLGEIEILRAVSFLAIVLQHVLAVYIYSPHMGFPSAAAACVVLTLSRFGVPAFVFITGFVLFYNYRDLDYGAFIKKRFVQAVVPYLFWSAFYSVDNIFTSGPVPQNASAFVKTLLNHFLHGSAMYHLWFMVLIVQFYIAFPLFKGLVEKFGEPKKSMGLLAVVFLYQFAALYLYHRYLPDLYSTAGNAIVKDFIAFRDRNFLFWSFYFVLGGVLALNLEKLKELIKKYVYMLTGGWVLSFAYVICVSLKTGSYDEKGGYAINYMTTSPVDIRMFVYLVLSVLLLYYFSLWFLPRFERTSHYLITVGKYSFGGYLVHAFFINRMDGLLMGSLSGTALLLRVSVLYILVASASVLTAALLKKVKIPFIKTLMGS
jgi:surface polysaccharide O-acyltransferase-like enzyme